MVCSNTIVPICKTLLGGADDPGHVEEEIASVASAMGVSGLVDLGSPLGEEGSSSLL